MSVLIDMEMPKGCADCNLISGRDPEELECVLTGKEPVLYDTDYHNLPRPDWCPVHAVPEEIDVPIYDKETRHENCTVQILENTKTGKVSIGWWRNE